MLELAILGLLKEHELHGYELKRRLSETLGLLSVSFGSLYPALARLERAGAVRVVAPPDQPTATIPMTGSLAGERAAFRTRRASGLAGRAKGRSRKVYGITPEGERLFEELLAARGRSADDARSFGLKLAFARHLAPEARLRLLERRRAELLQRLAKANGTEDDFDAYTRALIEHNKEATELDISWLDRLIHAERVSAGPVRSLGRPHDTSEDDDL